MATEIESDQTGLLTRGLHFASIISLVVALTTFLFNAWVSRTHPSPQTDSLIYHLTIPAFWTQQGFLHTVDLPFHDGAAEHSPLFTETLIYGLMRLTGSDDLAWLVQPTFFLLTVFLFHCSARLLGLNAITARFLTAFVVLFSPFFHSALVVNSEMVMTCGTAAFCYGMLLTRTQRERGCYVAAAGIALTYASKTIGVIYGSLALLIFVAWFVAAVRATDGQEQEFRWRRAAVVCAAILLLGWTFHLRNLWQYGNPLHPADLAIAGIRILPGRYDPSVFVNHGWSPSALRKMLLYDTESYAMSRQFGIVLWGAMLVPLTLLAVRRLTRGDIVPMALFVLYPLASVLMYFFVTPFWAEHRLLFPVYYLLWVGLAWSLHLVMRSLAESKAEWITAAAGLAFVVYAICFLFYDEVPFWLLGAAGALGLVLANYPSVLEKGWQMPWVAPAAIAAIMTVSSPWWFPATVRERAAARAEVYPHFYKGQGAAWNLLAELTAGKPATVAYSGNAITYPLFGPDLANQVVYLPIHPQDQPNRIELVGGPSIYLQLARERRAQVDEEFWLQQLREKEVDYLFLVDDPALGGVQAERSIAAQHPKLLQLIFEQDNVWIYAVKRGS